jgi:hypothetical protein
MPLSESGRVVHEMVKAPNASVEAGSLTPVNPSRRGFLMAHFVAMLVWVALLAGGYVAYRSIGPHVDNDFARWLVSIATLAAAIWVGNRARRRILGWLDADGELRRQMREEVEASRRRS